MASAPRKPPASSQAEVALLPSLKNCLLNLPSSLVNVLSNANTLAQNVVVELSFKQAAGSDGKPGKQQSVFLGWTGMRSQTRRSGPRQEQEVAGVEVDGTFGRLLGLRDGMKVRVPAPLWSFLLDVVGTLTNCVVLVGCCIVAR
jgi:peroxin-1